MTKSIVYITLGQKTKLVELLEVNPTVELFDYEWAKRKKDWSKMDNYFQKELKFKIVNRRIRRQPKVACKKQHCLYKTRRLIIDMHFGGYQNDCSQIYTKTADIAR